MRTVRDVSEMEIGFLEDVDISNGYVSIVTRGANQTPFTIVKVQDGTNPPKKESIMKKGARVAKTLIAPKGTTKEAIQEVFGDHLNLNNKIETSKHDIYSLLDSSLFMDESLQLFKVQEGENAFRVVAGTLQKAPEGDTILGTIRQKAAPVSVLQVSEELEAKDLDPVAKEMSWELYDEVSALSSGIYAILAQKVGSGDEKLGMIQQLYSNFEAFCAEVFTTLQAKAADPIEPRPVEKAEEVEIKKEDGDPAGNLAPAVKPPDPVVEEEGELEAVEKEEKEAQSAAILAAFKQFSDRLDGFEEALKGVSKIAEEMEVLKKGVRKIQTEGIPARVELPGDPPNVKKTEGERKSKLGGDRLLDNLSIFNPVRR